MYLIVFFAGLASPDAEFVEIGLLFGAEFADWDFAATAGDFDDIGRHGDTGQALAQFARDFFAFSEGGAEVAGTACEVGVVQVIGDDARIQQVVHQAGEGGCIGIDAFEQYGLRVEQGAAGAQGSQGSAGIGG